MELLKKYRRRSFFFKAGTGAAGFFVINAFPFNLFSRKEKISRKANVEINPLAISRKSTGEKNVR